MHAGSSVGRVSLGSLSSKTATKCRNQKRLILSLPDRAPRGRWDTFRGGIRELGHRSRGLGTVLGGTAFVFSVSKAGKGRLREGVGRQTLTGVVLDATRQLLIFFFYFRLFLLLSLRRLQCLQVTSRPILGAVSMGTSRNGGAEDLWRLRREGGGHG